MEYKEYKRGPRDLDPWGTLKIQKYDDDTGLYETIEKLENNSVEVEGSWWSGSRKNYQYSEMEWVKEAIKKGKELGADRVSFYAIIGMESWVRSEVIWEKR